MGWWSLGARVADKVDCIVDVHYVDDGFVLLESGNTIVETMFRPTSNLAQSMAGFGSERVGHEFGHVSNYACMQ